MDNLNKIFIESVAELIDWLHINHDNEESVWLIKWKKETGEPFISYNEIVDQLLCYGWVDSLPRKLDDQKTMLLISPRNPKSNWSGVNKKRVARLIKKGMMKPSGMKVITLAKKNGSWSFLNDVEKLIVPDDLASALKRYDKAVYYFNRFPNSSKRGILEWIKNAKKQPTREKRIEETAFKASQNMKANHPKGRDSGPIDKSK